VARFGLFTLPLRICSIAGSLLAYRWAARFGERAVFYALLAGFSGGMLVLGSTSSMAAFAIFPLLSFCNATLHPVTSDYVNRRSPQHLRATLASVASMGTSVMVAVLEVSMGATADHRSLQAAFLLGSAAVTLLGGAALVAWTLASRWESGARPAADLVAAGIDER
jgi:MFS family permease